MAQTYKLSTPIKTHNGEITELTLKEPVARCFVKFGEPFRMVAYKAPDGEQRTDLEFNYPALVGFLTEMTEPKLDALMIETLPASDFIPLRYLAANVVMGLVGANP